MQIKLIWAQAQERVIGKDGKMPWHLPEDLAHFKRTTQGSPVIMGRKTWDSLPAAYRPLPGRLNIIISRDRSTREKLSQNGCQSFQNLHESLSFCEQTGAQEVWIIGGAQIYQQALPLAHQVHITHIHAAYIGDTFAPALDPATWQASQCTHTPTQSGIPLDFVRYERQSPPQRSRP